MDINLNEILDRLATWPWGLGVALIAFGLLVMRLGWIKSKEGDETAKLSSFRAPAWLWLCLVGIVIVLFGLATFPTSPNDEVDSTPSLGGPCDAGKWQEAADRYIQEKGYGFTWIDSDGDCLHNEYERNSTGTPLDQFTERDVLPSLETQFIEGLLLDGDSTTAACQQLNADERTNFDAADLRDCAVQVNLKNGSYVGATAAGLTVREGEHFEADFSRADLTGAQFTGSTLRDMTFDQAILTDVLFGPSSDMSRSSLRLTDLREVRFDTVDCPQGPLDLRGSKGIPRGMNNVDTACGFGVAVGDTDLWGRVANDNGDLTIDIASVEQDRVGKALLIVENVEGGYDAGEGFGADVLLEGTHARWFDADSCDASGWCWAEGDGRATAAERDDLSADDLSAEVGYAQRWTFDPAALDLCQSTVQLVLLQFEGDSLRATSAPSAPFSVAC